VHPFDAREPASVREVLDLLVAGVRIGGVAEVADTVLNRVVSGVLSTVVEGARAPEPSPL
jgi:hypothetical protein